MSVTQVQCAFCSGVVGHWEAGDDPSKEHRRHFPSCPLHFNVPVGNIPLGQSNDSVQQYQNARDGFALREFRPFSAPERIVVSGGTVSKQHDFTELGIQTHRGPRHPKYATVESRLRTFINWSPTVHQTPQQLAQAGFYSVGKSKARHVCHNEVHLRLGLPGIWHGTRVTSEGTFCVTGQSDQVRCFHCDGGLRHWDPEDDPWTEHARWFSQCGFVLLVKGDEFVQQALIQHPPVLPVCVSMSLAASLCGTVSVN